MDVKRTIVTFWNKNDPKYNDLGMPVPFHRYHIIAVPVEQVGLAVADIVHVAGDVDPPRRQFAGQTTTDATQNVVNRLTSLHPGLDRDILPY